MSPWLTLPPVSDLLAQGTPGPQRGAQASSALALWWSSPLENSPISRNPSPTASPEPGLFYLAAFISPRCLLGPSDGTYLDQLLILPAGLPVLADGSRASRNFAIFHLSILHTQLESLKRAFRSPFEMGPGLTDASRLHPAPGPCIAGSRRRPLSVFLFKA